MLRILVIINGSRNQAIRGGDYRVMKVLAHYSKEHQISFVMPKLGYESAKHMLGYEHSIYFSSQKETEEKEDLIRLLISYLGRAVKSLFFTSSSDIDVIIASSHRLYDVFPAIFLSRRLNSKFVVYVHHLLSSFRTHKAGVRTSISLICEKISLWLCANANLIFVMNSDIKDYLIAKGFDSKRIFVTKNAVEHQLIDQVKVPKKVYDACFCGCLIKSKGIFDLIEIWQKVLAAVPPSKLIIIGYGQEYSNMLKIVKRKGLDDAILMAGYVSERDKIHIMKSSRIFILPSYEEGWAIAISEAIACGLPVICYDLPSYRVYDNVLIKVNKGNKEMMSKAVVHLLSTGLEKNAQFIANAEAIIRRLDWSRIAIEELQKISELSYI